MPIEIEVPFGTPPAGTVPPFAASIEGVQALIPEAKIVDELAPGQRGVTVAQATAWLVDFSGRVSLRLAAREQLPVDDPRRDLIDNAARDLVHNAVASYVEAARFPERSLDGYALTLWNRYQEGLVALVDWLTPGDGGDGGDLDGFANQPAFNFPLPMGYDRARF